VSGARGEKVAEAPPPVQDLAGDEDLVEAIAGGQMDFDLLSRKPRNMNARWPSWVGCSTAGPMPIQGGTVNRRPGRAKSASFQGGQARIPRRSTGNPCTCASARPAQRPRRCLENLKALQETIDRRNPVGAKGRYWRSLTIKTPRMGPASTLTSSALQDITPAGELKRLGIKVLNWLRPGGTRPAKTAGGQIGLKTLRGACRGLFSLVPRGSDHQAASRRSGCKRAGFSYARLVGAFGSGPMKSAGIVWVPVLGWLLNSGRFVPPHGPQEPLDSEEAQQISTGAPIERRGDVPLPPPSPSKKPGKTLKWRWSLITRVCPHQEMTDLRNNGLQAEATARLSRGPKSHALRCASGIESGQHVRWSNSMIPHAHTDMLVRADPRVMSGIGGVKDHSSPYQKDRRSGTKGGLLQGQELLSAGRHQAIGVELPSKDVARWPQNRRCDQMPVPPTGPWA